MTQFAKEEIRQKILAAAKEEFLRCGFEKASIRTIAAKANTAKSNLYNYFKDKDALFAAVLEPTVTDIRKGLKLAGSENEGRSADTYTIGSQEKYINIVMMFVSERYQDIMLLLFHSGGSSLEGFKDEVTEQFTDILTGWFGASVHATTPSRLFIRCVASFYITAVEQILLERPSGTMAARYMGEFLKFVYGGWNSLMQQ